MELFEPVIQGLRSFIREAPQAKSWVGNPRSPWPGGGTRNIVLKDDVGLELGGPTGKSLSCLVWTHDLLNVSDGRITLIGPDFSESMGGIRPLGKVVLVGVEGFTEQNAYERHREMDLLRYDLDLQGFMIRAVSRHMNEWCRVSKSAVEQGFSAHILGSSLMELFRKKAYVRAVEILFVTSSLNDLKRLEELTESTVRTISAMNKMAGEMDFDCDECEYQDVCDDAEDLKKMRDAFMKRQQEAKNAEN
jgi:CO dehydrogenase/acetyl-CoA synthase beta subunit